MGRFEKIKAILFLLVVGILIVVAGMDFLIGEYRSGFVVLLGIAYMQFFLWSGRNWDSFSQKTRNICFFILMVFVFFSLFLIGI